MKKLKELLSETYVFNRDANKTVSLADFKSSNDEETYLMSYSSQNFKGFNHLMIVEFANIKTTAELQYIYDYLLSRNETLMVTRTAQTVCALIYVSKSHHFVHMQSSYKKSLPSEYKDRLILSQHIDKYSFYNGGHVKLWKDEDAIIVPFDYEINGDKIVIDDFASWIARDLKRALSIPHQYDCIDCVDLIYYCVSAEKAGVYEAYHFCQQLLKNTNFPYFKLYWDYAKGSTITNIYKCREKSRYYELLSIKPPKRKEEDNNCMFKYNVEKDENGNITNFEVKNLGSNEFLNLKYQDYRRKLRCSQKPNDEESQNFAYIERDGKPFTL